MPFMWALWLCRAAQTSAAVGLAGTAALGWLARGTGLDPAWGPWARLRWSAGAGLLLAGALLLGLEAAEMSGQPLAQVFTGRTLGEVLGGTRFGGVWWVRMSLLGGWFAVAFAAARRPGAGPRTRAALEAGGLLLAAALLGSLVFAGHAQASPKSAWLLPVAAGHALAAGAWPGGLLPLAFLLARAQRDPALVPATVIITRRFSRLSLGAVGVLAFSGLVNGVSLVGPVSALWTSAYGRLVLCKTVLFAVMIGLGASNRRLLRRTEPVDPVRRLWRNVAVECALAVGVLLATEALAMSAPSVGASMDR